ncbi:MAG: alpha/beta hydrolase [Angustibacter sp.]
MSLLGRPLLVLLVLLTVGFPVATVLLWGRLGRRRVGCWAGRGGLLVAAQLSAVLLAGVALNDYGYFYTSWSDLVASASPTSSASPAAVSSSGATARSATARGGDLVAASGIHVLGDIGATSPAEWARVGRVLSVRISGVASQLSSQAYVWLPPQYFAPGPRRAFPAVELLSGYPGAPMGLVRGMHYPETMLGEITAHRAAPMVLVMLQPSVVYPRDTECTNVPAGPQVETFLAQDVPAAVDAGLRVRPSAWGIMGYSTGGYCAAKIAMDHFDRFRAGVALSGYFVARHDHTTGDLWAGSSALQHLNDLEWRLRHQPAPPTSLFLATSRSEAGPYGYVDTRRFVALVRSPLQVTTLTLPSGGHSFATWTRESGPALDWLSARLAGTGAGLSGGPGGGLSGPTTSARRA